MTDRYRVVVDCSEDQGRTKQSFKDECDINKLVEKFKAGLPIPEPPARTLYGNFIDAADYQESMQNLAAADTAFAELPSEVRARFNNEPAQLLEFCDNPENSEEGVQLGLFNPPAMPLSPIDEPDDPELGGSDPDPDE